MSSKFTPSNACVQRNLIGKKVHLKNINRDGKIISVRQDGYFVEVESRRLGSENQVFFCGKQRYKRSLIMSLKDIREKNRLKDSIIYKSSKRKDVEIKLSEEDKEFYRELMNISCKTVSKYLDKIEKE